MASTDSTQNKASFDDEKTNPSDLESPIPEKKPEDVAKSEEAGPPDGGATAWLVVLGAWCCSFSSPGWINSAYYRCVNSEVIQYMMR